jgi:hypothetical protein
VSYLVECSQDHVRLLDDLPNNTTLAQKIVATLVFLVTEILAIEKHKLYCTFLHVALRSQSLLRSSSEKIDSGTN